MSPPSADRDDPHPQGVNRPLDPQPGHSSRGRLERVLRRGEFAVTADLNPPDRANPQDVYERAATITRELIEDAGLPAYAIVDRAQARQRRSAGDRRR